jgi:hypothetical protein
MNAYNPRVMERSGQGGVPWWDVGNVKIPRELEDWKGILGMSIFSNLD